MEIKKTIDKNSMLLISTTLCIWIFEILAFIMVLGYINSFEIQIILLILFIMLSFVLPVGPIGFGGIQLAIFWYTKLTNSSIDMDFAISQTYIIYISGLLIGLILFIYENINKSK